MADSGIPITPFYSTPRANQPISLGRDTIRITCEGHQFTCPGEAILYLQPKLRLILNADVSAQPAIGLSLLTATGVIELQYGIRARPVNVLLVNGTGHSVSFIPNPERLTICDNRRKRLASVTFHVMNFPAFLSRGASATDLQYKGQRLGRAFLEHGGWRIELQTLPNARKLIEELKIEGGFAITHVGHLARRDGSRFYISQAEEALHHLHQFLSFARGLWVPLVLPVGVNTAGDRIFEEWGMRLATAWEPRVSWFDDHNGQVLAELFPGFIDLLHDPDMGEPVKNAVYWYLRSNRAGEGAGVDSGIILSQAALERLTNAYLSKAGLRTGGKAADRFRRAFLHLNLPTAVPKRMGAITTGRRKGVWTDLPEVVAKVRNELTHPNPRLPFQVGKVVAPVWMIAQWYIELSILALSGYRGVYLNRLRARWRGQVEQVPWK